MKTKIPWTDYSWNCITGCTPVSTGCLKCYASAMARRGMGPWKDRAFSDVRFFPKKLNMPFTIKKPSIIFVNSMGDIFHDRVLLTAFTKLLPVIRHNPQHTFLMLTKRPENAVYHLPTQPENAGLYPNLWVGITAENQELLDKRMAVLAGVWPQGRTFTSIEPMLGPVGITDLSQPAWIICGPENGHGKRPFKKEWAERLYLDCRVYGIPFFYKGADGGLPKEWPKGMK